MKKKYFIGVVAGCALLMLGCANQKKDPIDDPDMPAVTDNTGITEGAEGIAGQESSSTNQAAATVGNQTDSAGETEEIGIEAAKNIALTKINLTEQDGSWKEEKRDRDDGRVVYDLEFVSDKIEYEFEIDALNGKILEYQKDSVDD